MPLASDPDLPGFYQGLNPFAIVWVLRFLGTSLRHVVWFVEFDRTGF